MDLLKDLESLSEKIKQQRDEIAVQLNLAGKEAKDEWEHAEQKWTDLKHKAEEIKDDTKDTTEELISAAKVVAEELSGAYQRIIDRIKK
ncbi:MAG: hypothetical protein CVV06_17135 [Gammaproteobacteria bacterium HGW-Gammaproteobacteria-10]|nr:MAG: hypothetical protein CVV06_17135 [Gammaproteobacteria bacterium HGW-Gammaproteobacteria-10]